MTKKTPPRTRYEIFHHIQKLTVGSYIFLKKKKKKLITVIIIVIYTLAKGYYHDYYNIVCHCIE